MSITGKVKTLFSDKEKTQAMFPCTKVKAVSDDNGTGLNVLLDDIHAEIDGLAYNDVGAAPDGYGLGADAPSITLTDCNDATKSGWYRTADGTANQPLARANWMRVDAYSSMYLCQTWFNDQYDGCTATRFKIGDNKWTPWEWVNPPMALGVEYRTTERWNANPVYTMMANIGALPNNTGKTTEGGPLPMGITPISAYGIGLNGKTGAVIPSRHIYLSVYGEWGTVYVNTDSDYSNYTGYIIVKYVKIKEGRQ